ncbi:MAG: alpha/beta hydrolase [Catenulispora sp.]|nr:alpha/beta hydrolase [Catenulispora sp.]
MPNITAAHSHAGKAELYYEDHGIGTPVVLIHGYPLDARFWEKQIPALLAAGHRTVAYDRRGFGRSAASPDGSDFDTFAADLNAVLEALDLADAVLIGQGMGTGEVIRYLGTYGAGRVSKAVLLAPLPPFLLRTEETPHGVDLAYFDEQIARAREDPVGFLTAFAGDMFAGAADAPETAIQSWTEAAATLSPRTCAAAIPTWITDFRADVAAVSRLDLPILILHGSADRILPIDATAHPLRKLLPTATFIELPGAPHGMQWTHADSVNRALVRFLLS